MNFETGRGVGGNVVRPNQSLRSESPVCPPTYSYYLKPTHPVNNSETYEIFAPTDVISKNPGCKTIVTSQIFRLGFSFWKNRLNFRCIGIIIKSPPITRTSGPQPWYRTSHRAKHAGEPKIVSLCATRITIPGPAQVAV